MQINQLSPNGFMLTDVFESELLNEICNTCKTFEPTRVLSQGFGSREAYFLKKGNLREKIINSIRPIIQQAMTKNFYIRGVELWRDYPRYINPYHYDDPMVQNIMIVYLDNDLENGTGYIENNIDYKAPYKKNTGIILLNSTSISHGMVVQVPDNVIRKTLYINWLID